MQDLKAQWIRNGKLAPNTSMAEMPAIASPVWQVKKWSVCLLGSFLPVWGRVGSGKSL
jgi:hypothetical protein